MSRSDKGGAAAEIIIYLKNEARLLQKNAEAGDGIALARLQKNSPAVALGADVQRKHALAVVARECGFRSWKAVTDCFAEKEGASFEGFLYPKSCHVYWNIWFATHQEAAAVRADHGGYLLTFENQFLVVDEHYIRSLGVDPDDGRWNAIRRDWAKPVDFAARDALALAIAKKRLHGGQERASVN